MFEGVLFISLVTFMYFDVFVYLVDLCVIFPQKKFRVDCSKKIMIKNSKMLKITPKP